MSTNNRLTDIPFLTASAANLIAECYLNEDSNIAEILKYLMFFDPNISNQLFAKALKNNIDDNILISSINPFINIDLCNDAVAKALNDRVDAKLLLEKVCPYISQMLVKQVVEYSILQKCDAQIVTQNASSYADEETINIITDYAIQSRLHPSLIVNALYSMANLETKIKIDEYREWYVANNQKNDSKIEEAQVFECLKTIFDDSGIEISEENIYDDLELDSLHSISIICEIEDVFNVCLTDDILQKNELLSFNDYLEIVTDLIDK